MYKLYNVKNWGSLAIHCLLEEMAVPYTNIWMTKDQVRAPDYREINPLGFIPALGLSDGRALYESAAIVSFLVAAHPEAKMSPPLGSDAYGEFMTLLHVMSTDLYPAISASLGESPYAQNAEQERFIVGKAQEQANDIWKLLEKRLTSAGPWLMGREFTALDPYCFMLSRWMLPSEAEHLKRFPALAKLSAAVRARPKLKAVLDSHGAMAAAA